MPPRPHHPVPKRIIRRPTASGPGCLEGLHPLLQRIYLARDLTTPEDLDRSLARLPSPWLLSGMEAMVDHLADAIRNRRHVLVVADFDADGATSCAVAVRGLRLLGAQRVSYLVPNRFEYGYGLTPEIVAVASRQQPDMLITVDNGISSIEGVRAARERGIRVLITDHHLPGAELPEAEAIVNPSLPGDVFPGKSLAGVGVMFYVLMALRTRLRETGWFAAAGIAEPNLGQLLDLVALGTVADVVTLDRVNRILVHQGLQRIRAGHAHPGLSALLEVAGRKPQSLTAADLAFAAAPRLNAAGRIDDMSLGIECLLAQDSEAARPLAVRLDSLNRERREIEDQMKQDALSILQSMETVGQYHRDLPALCLFDPSWHQGVIGILASRIKDRLHRPVIAFAPSGNGEIKGSARSIPGVHIRDALSNIAANHPTLLSRFGGHALAAGLSLRAADLQRFTEAFAVEVAKHLEGLDLDHVVYSDGELAAHEMRLESAELLQQAGPWGQGFPEPLFDGEFEVVQSRVVGTQHLKLVLKAPDQGYMIDGIAFFVEDPEQWLAFGRLRAAYRLDINEFRNQRSLQLRIEYMEPCRH